jgi:hypothetical protein
MIDLKCNTQDTLTLIEMVPFQGDLKRRTSIDVDALKGSLLTEGLLMPFAIWHSDDNLNYILDGHGRYEAIVKIALTDPSVLTQKFPVIIIKAASEVEARKALLQIVSTYGRVTTKGLKSFIVSIPEYKAPVIKSLVKLNYGTKMEKTQDTNTVLVRLKCPKNMLSGLIELLKKVNGIEVL